MPKTAADGRTRVTFLKKEPKDPNAITVAELKAGIELSGQILKSDFELGPTGSNTISETELCTIGEGQAFGLSTGSGSITFFRLLDAAGKPASSEETAWEALKVKGTEGWLVRRDGPLASVDWTVGDEYSAFRVSTDDPQYVGLEGYIKRKIPLAISDMRLDKQVSGSAS